MRYHCLLLMLIQYENNVGNQCQSWYSWFNIGMFTVYTTGATSQGCLMHWNIDVKLN